MALSAALALPALGAAQPAQPSSLAQVLDSLRDMIVAEGPSVPRATVRDTASGEQWSYQRCREWSDFVNDAAGCNFSFHYRMLEGDDVKSDKPGAGIALGEVRTIAVEDLDPVMSKVDAQGGHPTWVTHNQPQIWRVNMVRADGSQNAFYFYSLNHARRTAALFKRAAELCNATVQMF